MGAWHVPGAAPLMLVEGSSRLLRPDEQVFESMLSGRTNQQAIPVEADHRPHVVVSFQRGLVDTAWRKISTPSAHVLHCSCTCASCAAG